MARDQRDPSQFKRKKPPGVQSAYIKGSQKGKPKDYKNPNPLKPEDRAWPHIPICGAKRSKNSANNGKGICCHVAGWGTDHPGIGLCRYHGGNIATHVLAAELDRQVTMANQKMAKWAVPVDIGPHEALLSEVQRTAGHVIWLKDFIAAFTDTEDMTQSEEALGRVSPSVWIDMYHTERAHLLNACKAAIAGGVAERQVRLAEEQGKLIAMVLQSFIRDPELNLTPAQMSFAPRLIRRHLLAIDNMSSADPVPQMIQEAEVVE